MFKLLNEADTRQLGIKIHVLRNNSSTKLAEKYNYMKSHIQRTRKINCSSKTRSEPR